VVPDSRQAVPADCGFIEVHENRGEPASACGEDRATARITADPAAVVTPCTVIFGAKAAPGYRQARRSIKLINSVAAVMRGPR
jgi:glycogen phosphorylase